MIVLFIVLFQVKLFAQTFVLVLAIWEGLREDSSILPSFLLATGINACVIKFS